MLKVPVMEHKVCSFCGRPGKALRRCTGCWHVLYCSRDCQQRDWPRHKRTCCKRSSPSTGDVQPSKVLSTEKSAVKSNLKEGGNDLSAASEIVCKTCKNPCSTAAVNCPRCQEVTYCSRDCRRADWLKHMVTCVPAPTTKADQEKKTQESSSNAKPSTPPLEVPGTKSIPTGENAAAGISSHAKPTAEERVECDGEEVKTCRNCKTKKTSMKRCARCQEVTYCSRDCQSGDWPTHKVTCQPIEVVTTDVYRETVRREAAKRKQEAEANDLANPLLSYLRRLSAGTTRTGTTRQRFNWQGARSWASKEFPGKRIVDDFERLDSDFSGQTIFLHQLFGMKDMVALGRLTGFIPHPHWPAWGVEDIKGKGAHAIFYWDHYTDFYRLLMDGYFLCIEGAYLSLFEDGSVGFKVFYPSSVRVIHP